MSLRFGTDGMRGDARDVLTTEAVEALGRAGAEILGADGFVVGRDTRESGPALAAAIHAGVNAAGGTSVDLGVVPTPAVALWCAEEGVAGAMVSASHNPWHDNGIKFFAPGGSKLGDAVQDRIQARFDELLAAADTPTEGTPTDRHADAVERHVAAVVASLDGRSLVGLRVVADAANGAASTVAGAVFERLGADVTVIHADPDGRNINDECGSTHPASLQAAVLDHGADLGVAFDGDADRLVAVDAAGEIVDGDQIIAVCALDRHERGVLTGDAVVVTVMTNLGFRRSMEAAGIHIIDTKVGDRYVLEALDAGGYSLGGEQSGHVIFRELASTGDGVLSAVQLLDVVVRTGRSLTELAGASMTRLPQVLRNVRVASRPDDVDTPLAPFVDASIARMAGRGRVLIRPSGTEPLIRVMVEAETDAEAQMEADGLVSAVESLFS
ncbi:MAG: phosphoglucosamine mutase [Acidimicrobiales bacterium]|nr:MAG: phosphoglucosamine mutase [Acidimicrobiales bacterium]